MKLALASGSSKAAALFGESWRVARRKTVRCSSVISVGEFRRVTLQNINVRFTTDCAPNRVT